MAFSFSDQGNGTSWTTGSVAAAAVNVASGDLIVVSIGVLATDTWCTGVTDTQGNSYTARSYLGLAGTTLVMAYCIDANANANNVVTATFNNATAARKNIIVSVYTPDSGETVTLDVAMNKQGDWEASPWETGTDDTTGTDEVCIAGMQAGGGAYSNHEIPGGTAATALVDPGNQHDGWYRILTSTASGLYAEVDSAASARYCIEMLCFKSEAAGGEEHEKNLSDTINLSDACVFLFGSNKSDSISLSDSPVKNIGRPLTDTISMSDGMAKNVGLSESDSITMSDGIAKAPGLPRSDTITLSDNASKVASFLRSLNDAITLSDNFGKEVGLGKADTITMSDNLVSMIIAIIMNLSDTINLSDGLVKNIGTARSDTINLSDNFGKVIAYLRSFADTITLSALGSREAGLNKADTVTLTDSMTKEPRLSKTDIITLSESIAKEMGLSKADTITLSDFFSTDAGGSLLFIIEQLGFNQLSGIF